MGVNVSNLNNPEDKDLCKYPNLNPQNAVKLKRLFENNPTTQIDRKKLMELLQISKFETETLFDFFDIDGNGFIDSYEFICCSAMLTHTHHEVRYTLN